jgi:hypothetical protein
MSKFYKSLAAFAVGALAGNVGAGDLRGVLDGTRVTAPMPAGCYVVKRGFMAEQSIDVESVVGQYTFLLAPVNDPTSRGYVVSGPLSGVEGGDEALRVRKSRSVTSGAKPQEDEGPHGGHKLGTSNRVGTLTSEGDVIQVTNTSCPDANGIPLYIQGVETLTFVRGTGVFGGLLNGRIDFNLTFDACTKQPQANLEVIQGQLCFQ